MEKIKLKFSKKSNIPITFFGTEISVNPIIKIEEQRTLRNIFIESLFRQGRDEQWDEQFAEFMFRRGILGLKTNIDIDSIKDVEEIDELVNNDFGQDMELKQMPNSKPYTQKEAREMAQIISLVYSKSHCITCEACQRKYLV